MSAHGHASFPIAAPVPLSFATKSETVYAELRTRILRGTVVPGSTLNQEALASEFGVSVTPLREALRRLAAEGLVRLEAHKTLTIAPLSKRELDETYAIRLQLDPYAASLAATHASDERIAEMVLLAVEPHSDDWVRQLAVNRAFHRSVYFASGNLVLTEMLDQLWDRTDRYRLILLRRGAYSLEAAKEHVDIAAALRSRDAPRVQRLTYKHVETAYGLISELAGEL
jgi:DNA-binding GntR family transcriptional regulator